MMKSQKEAEVSRILHKEYSKRLKLTTSDRALANIYQNIVLMCKISDGGASADKQAWVERGYIEHDGTPVGMKRAWYLRGKIDGFITRRRELLEQFGL